MKHEKQRAPMRKRVTTSILVVGVVVVATGATIALASGNDSEGGVTGPERARAVHAALEATGGGTVGAVERDAENGATWEVEITRSDGSTVDVRLDDQYQLVVIDGDGETNDSGDGQG